MQSGSQLSEVRIVVTDSEQLVTQDYKNTTTIVGKNRPSEDFNYNLKNYPNYIYGFMSPLDSIIDKNVITKVMRIFDKYPIVSVIYTDLCIAKDDYEYLQFFPSASSDVFSKQIINAPVFVKPSNNKILFDERLQHLYFHDFLKRAISKNLIHHIAEPLIKRTLSVKINTSMIELESIEDIKLLQHA